jgi:hypothetical protein
MEDAERHALVRQLGEAMSDISEACYYAGWLTGAEYLVPELCRRAISSGRAIYWGHGCVTPESARELIALAERAGSWAALDEPGIGFVPFRPFPIPARYVELIEREQSSAYALSQGCRPT